MRLVFYGHLERLDHRYITFQTYNTISERLSSAKWTTQIEKRSTQAKIDRTVICNRNEFKILRTIRSFPRIKGKLASGIINTRIEGIAGK